MKKIILGLLAIGLFSTAIQAQEKGNNSDTKGKQAFGHHRHGFKKGHHSYFADLKKLNLTEDQKDKMKKINDDFRNKTADLKKQEATITVKDYKAQMRALGKQRHEQVENVFTREQKDQLAKMKVERQKKFDQASKERMEKMKAKLGLSEDQSAKLKQVREDAKEKMKSIRANQSLSPEEKKEQVITVFKKQRDDMKSILTPEQLKKMEGLRQAHHHNDTK